MNLTDPQFLEREYNARAAIPDHPEIFARWRERSDAARARMHCEPDFYYGTSPAETLDIFPARHSGVPMLVFIHGGYWRSLDKRDFAFIAEPLVDAGIAVAVVNYALCPAVTIEDIVRQALRACAWIWRNCMGFGADPNRLYLAGHSAGAHLAAMMLAADWPAYAHDLPAGMMRGALAVSGIYDLEPLVHAHFLENDLRLTVEAARHLSPIRYRPATPRPLVTAVGALESSEFKRQSAFIAEAWPHSHARHIDVPGENHLSVIETLGDSGSVLSRAARELVGR